LRHANSGAGWGCCRVHILVPHLTVVREVRADVDNIVVELDDVPKTRADRSQRSFHILERDFDLFACIGPHFACLVDAELTSEIDSAAGSGHFHHMAVARRLLQGVGAREADVVWHVWAPVGLTARRQEMSHPQRGLVELSFGAAAPPEPRYELA